MATDLWVTSDIGLNFRDRPGGNLIASLPNGQHLTTIGAPNPPDANGTVFQQVRTDDGQTGYVAAVYQGANLLSTTQPTATSSSDVWVNSNDGLNLRDKPGGNLLAVIPNGQHLTAIGSPNPPDANGTVFQQVRTDDNQTGYVAAIFQGTSLLSTTKPTTTTTTTSTTDRWVNSDIGLNFRDKPGGNLIATIPNGQHLTAIGSPNPPDVNGTVFQQVRTDDGQIGFVAALFQGSQLLSPTKPIAPVSVVPWGKCFAGVGMADPRPFTSTDKSMLQKSKIEAFKVFILGDVDETKSLINDLRKINDQMFIVARLFFKPDVDNKPHFSPQNFVDTINTGMSACYAANVRYFEVHNEPNLTDEGMGWNWTDGTAFSTWLIQVLSILRLKYPEAKLGYPGLSPQPNVPDFVNGSASAIAQCDWIGAHCYWQTPAAMQADSDGMYWRRFRTQFPTKMLMITEFSNNTANVSADQKGQQYAQYYQLLRHENNLGAAFSFALNWPGQDKNREGWVFNNGETAIGSTVGAKISQPGFLG
jgi:Bacterial SH3 domain